MSNEELAATRRTYGGTALSASQMPADPFVLFEAWLADAQSAGLRDATAMVLATAANDVPSARVVLLKGAQPEALVWYTDTDSFKGAQLRENPTAELLFHWRELERQVRIRGTVSRVPDQQADDYFASRPRDSQLAASASNQSAPIANRAELEARVVSLDQPGEVKRPERWGGYQLRPQRYEFWLGREGRLHDRFEYQETAGGWSIQRLQP